MRINHNISAMISQNSLFSANRAMSKTIEKLSTGLRINSAADDAAGLGVSENLRKQVRGMGQALKNTQDTIALLNVADGALNEQSEILQRMRELVIQAKNDTMTDTERGYISQEFTGLMGELNRIAGVTNYNGMQIFAAPLVDRLGGGSPGLYGGTFTDADPNRAHFGRELFGAGNEDEHVFGADDYSSSRYFNMMIGANIDATDTMDPTTFSFASNAANMMTIELGDMSANGLLNINPGNNMVNAFLTFFNDFPLANHHLQLVMIPVPLNLEVLVSTFYQKHNFQSVIHSQKSSFRYS